jgi:hypothetical protein
MHLRILSLAVIGLILALLMFAAKPSREDFDREMASMLREAISGASYDHRKDLLSNLAAIGCKLRTRIV